jgi:hypothetical protein
VRNFNVTLRNRCARVERQFRSVPRYYRARGLYDKYTPHSGFLRYAVNNPVA